MWPAPCSWRASTWRIVVPLRERVVGRQDRAAREAEDDLDALGLERAENRVGARSSSCDRAPELEAQALRQLGEHAVAEAARRVAGVRRRARRVPTAADERLAAALARRAPRRA